MLKQLFLLAFGFLSGSIEAHAQQVTMLVGTYTEGSSSEGVYLYDFNQDTGDFVLRSQQYGANPSYVIPSPTGMAAFAVSEYNDGKQGAIAYRIDKGKLKLINYTTTIEPENTQKKSRKTDGADPCNLMTNGQMVVTANYTGGDISVIPIGGGDSLLMPSQHFCFPKTAEGKPAHIHCVKLTPDGRYLLATDLGNDCIYRFDVNPEANNKNGGQYLSNCQLIYQGDKGLGPRHFTFSIDGRFVYLINELGDVVNTFSYENGQLTKLQQLKAYDGEGHGSADIHIAPNGRFLYTSHRLKKDGIAVFRIHPKTGLLKPISFQMTGVHPRNFNISPNGKYLLCACRDTNTIEIYAIQKNGCLKDTGKRISLGKPVCIEWVTQL